MATFTDVGVAVFGVVQSVCIGVEVAYHCFGIAAGEFSFSLFVLLMVLKSR